MSAENPQVFGPQRITFDSLVKRARSGEEDLIGQYVVATYDEPRTVYAISSDSRELKAAWRDRANLEGLMLYHIINPNVRFSIPLNPVRPRARILPDERDIEIDDRPARASDRTPARTVSDNYLGVEPTPRAIRHKRKP